MPPLSLPSPFPRSFRHHPPHPPFYDSSLSLSLSIMSTEQKFPPPGSCRGIVRERKIEEEERRRKMDCLETVLLRKARGLRQDTVMLLSPPGGWQSPLASSSAEEEEPFATTDRNGLLWEDFSVDDLLDLGGGKEQAGAQGEGLLQLEDAEREEEGSGGWSSLKAAASSSASVLSFQAAFPPSSTSDPVVPVRSPLPPSMTVTSPGSPSLEKPNPSVYGFETTQAGEMEELEWVSRFVDDSYSEFASIAIAPPLANLHAPAAPAPLVLAEAEAPKPRSTNSCGPLKRSWRSCCFSTESVVVPGKARSKRPRTGCRVWSLRGPSLFCEPASSSCSSVSSSSSCFGFSSVTSSLCGGWVNPPDYFLHCLGGGPPLNQLRLPQPQVKKKMGRKPKASTAAAAAGDGSGGAEQQARRRCSHCGVDKTPQWRAGPMGPKTLCNACGVRYKSGRLLPEYRPAGSPTFLSHIHSNSHRKVLEIRRSNELLAGVSHASCSPPPLQQTRARRPYGVV